VEKQSKGNIQTPTFPLLIQEHPLSEPTVHNIAVGIRISDILKNAPKHSGAEPQVLVNGEKAHGNYKPKEDDIVYVTLVPGVELSWWAIAAIFVASAAISYALMPDIGGQQQGLGDENKFERISGLKNKTPLYEPYQAILGKRKVAPVYISRPYTTVEGDKEYFHALMSAGYGPLKLENFRIGETAISSFDDVEITVLDHYENTDENAIREVWQQDISQQLVQIELREEEGWTNRSTETNPATIVSNFLFPSGLFATDKEGNNEGEIAIVRQDVQDEAGDWWTVAKVDQFTNFGHRGQVFKYNGSWRVWTYTGYINDVINESTFIGYTDEVEITTENIVYLKDVPETSEIASLWYTDSTRKPKLKSIRLSTDVPELWPNNEAVNIRSRKVYPSQETVEENRGAANVQWENLQTIRPLTDEGFKEAIGYNRPRLRVNGNPIRNFRPTLIAVRMRATGQLNGNLDNFFCDASMVVPKSKDVDWRNWPDLTLEPSSNPADAYKWLMQGPMNYSPIPNDKIDNSKLSDWRSRCVSENWSISALLDYESTLLAELQNVAYTGRAEFQFNEGKFGVVEKIERTVPRQIFTPKNSANFQSKRVYPEVVDGVKFQFESAAVDYEKDEGIFLDPAKDPDNGGDASLLKGRYTTNELWGIDNFDQAYRLTRFEYYERFLQREIYTLDLDAEVLASNRGDLVRVQNDIINVGLGAGRVKAIDGSVVTLDETINTDNLPQNTGLQFRDDVGVITTTTASYLGDGQWDCSALDAGVSVGDLAMYGEAGKEAIDCIIRSVKYNEDLGASLTLVNAANEIYTFDGNPIPTYDPSISLPTDTTQPSAPIISANASRGDIRVVVNSPNEAYYNSYRVFIQVREYPVGIAPEDYFEDDNEGWNYEAQGENSQSLFTLQNLSRGVNYQVRAQFRGQSNTPSVWSNIEELFLPLGDVPLIITEIDYSHTLEGTYLLYTQVKDIEFAGYEIRTDDNFGVEDANFVGVTKDNSFFVGLRTTPETYYVAAKNNYGDYGQEVAIAVPVNEPNEPAGVTSKLEGLTVRLSWSKATGGYTIDYFEVRFNNWDETNRTLANSELLGSTDGLTFLHSIGIAGTYTYYIRAVDIAGNVSNYVTLEQIADIGSDNIRDELDNLETEFENFDPANSWKLGIDYAIEGISQDINEIFTRRKDINTESERRVQKFNELSVTIDDVSTATNLRIDEVQADADGNATAISGLQLDVGNLETGLNATINDLNQVEVTAGGNATAISILEGKVNDPDNNTSALYQIAQGAQTTADGNAESVTTILNGVTGEAGEADALLKLQAYYTDGGLGARAFLGTDINDRVTGIIVNDSGSAQTIEFQSDSVTFLDASSQPMIYFDNVNGRYVFDGEIIAQDGTFTGTINSSQVNGSSINGGSLGIGGSNDNLTRILPDGRLIVGEYSVSEAKNRVIIDPRPDADYNIWIGPYSPSDNGLFWIKPDGTGFISGEFFQGEIIETKTASDTVIGSGSPSATAVNHSSAGNPVKIDLSGDFNGTANGNWEGVNFQITLTIKRYGSQIAKRVFSGSGGLYDSLNDRTEVNVSGSAFTIDDNTSNGVDYDYSVSYSESFPAGASFSSVEKSVFISTFENKLG